MKTEANEGQIDINLNNVNILTGYIFGVITSLALNIIFIILS